MKESETKQQKNRYKIFFDYQSKYVSKHWIAVVLIFIGVLIFILYGERGNMTNQTTGIISILIGFLVAIANYKKIKLITETGFYQTAKLFNREYVIQNYYYFLAALLIIFGIIMMFI